MPQQFKESLLYTLWLLRDYLADIVLCGGWVPFIYREYMILKKPLPPLRTKDIDLAVPEKIPLKKEIESIEQILKKAGFDEIQMDSGFSMSYSGKSVHPILKFEYHKNSLDIEIGFITPLRGNQEIAVKRVQEGINAEALRYVDILLDNYEIIKITDSLFNGQSINLKVKIPTPAAYIFQKGLTFIKRKDALKKAKDLYYIYDLLSNYEELHDKIYTNFKIIHKKHPANWFKNFNKNIEKYFKSSEANGPFLIQKQYQGTMSHERLREHVHKTFQNFLLKLKEAMK